MIIRVVMVAVEVTLPRSFHAVTVIIWVTVETMFDVREVLVTGRPWTFAVVIVLTCRTVLPVHTELAFEEKSRVCIVDLYCTDCGKYLGVYACLSSSIGYLSLIPTASVCLLIGGGG